MSTETAHDDAVEKVRIRYGVSWVTPDGEYRQLPLHDDEAAAMREASDRLNTGGTDVQVWRLTTARTRERVL